MSFEDCLLEEIKALTTEKRHIKQEKLNRLYIFFKESLVSKIYNFSETERKWES